MHKQHVVGMSIPQAANLERVGSLSLTATHIWKACLGVLPLNHTALYQLQFGCLSLIVFHVLDEEKD